MNDELTITDPHELARHVYQIAACLHATHGRDLQWVINPAQLDIMRNWASTTAPPNQPATTLLGMHIRADEHATNPMLELRNKTQFPSSPSPPRRMAI